MRFNMDVDAERKAWEIIHEKGNGLVGKEVINAINASSELSNLEKMTNYTFLYKLDLVNKCGKVNVDATDQDFSQLLLELLNPLGLSFSNSGKTRPVFSTV